MKQLKEFGLLSVRYPKISLTIIFVLLGVGIFGALQLESEYNHKIWFRSDDPYLLKYEEFSDKFGNEDTITIALHNPKTIWNTETFQILRKLEDILWKTPYINRVDSLANHSHIYNLEDDIIIEPFLSDEIELNQNNLLSKKEKAETIEEFKNYLIDSRDQTTMIYATFAPIDEGLKQYGESLRFFRDELKKINFKDLEYYIAGTAPLNMAFRNISNTDVMSILPIVFALILLTLFLVFRSYLVVLFTLLELIVSIVITMGIGSLAGIKVSVVISMVPLIVAAIAIADTVHILSSYRLQRLNEVEHKEALKTALVKNIIPTFLTTISTGFGFLGLYFSELQPISNLGALTSLGILIAWMTSLFLVVPLIYYFPPRFKRHHNFFKFNISAYLNHLEKFKKSYLFVFVFLTLLTGYSALQNSVNSDILKYFDPQAEIRVANDFITDHIGGTAGVQILIDADKKDGIKNPDFLKRVSLFKDTLLKYREISKVSSALSILTRMNEVINNKDALPENSEQIAQLFLMYELGATPSKSIHRFITPDFSQMRLDIKWTVTDSQASIALIEKIKKDISRAQLNAEVTGKTSLMLGLDNYIVSTFYRSILLAVLLVVLFMWLGFRSLKLSLFSMIPNLAPLVWGLGLLNLMGQNIDVGVVLICSVCLGIAVDDTIYFFNHYRIALDAGLKGKAALKEVLQNAGRSLMFTTVILVLSFSSFAISQFVPNRNFGVMTALILSFALICDLVILPLLILYLNQEDKLKSSN
ncbi:MAG: hypothetical protein CME62_00735 [Halobacteriovoraceae bacterium]|nr:hypothetical protein [Halobacteriovoraceae bacterium]